MSATAVPDASLAIPSPVSALAFGPGGRSTVLTEVLDDGCLRWYNLPSTKVVKAIKSLGDEISSISIHSQHRNEPETAWVASGRNVFCLPTESQKMILSKDDAIAEIFIGEDDDDLLNELTLSDNGKTLAFSSDSGAVGIVDISNKSISRMKTRHTNVCGSARFIPDRPSELVSGGYDSAVLHFDVAQGIILSRFDIASVPPTPGQSVSLSPPFVLSLSVSPSGLLAASTADGRVWIGSGGEKRPGAAKKKRTRKWEGLKTDAGSWLQVAEGPVVATAFVQADRLITCTLLGTITEYVVSRDAEDTLSVAKSRERTCRSLEKVNAMTANGSSVAVGGFGKGGKGFVEVWEISPTV
ncbi:WD40 repeat-like protein [Epithele typhae]|uniref:WD40 repeat-like protein n=1 Tax=Epithele typhae TaxID=378194 RepID=UPI0020080347|nr:WD40 repeat-like protein [Epithele typhae]KAH9945888.1 WD40 repeat-like protein [Epithele typhae]